VIASATCPCRDYLESPPRWWDASRRQELPALPGDAAPDRGGHPRSSILTLNLEDDRLGPANLTTAENRFLLAVDKERVHNVGRG
jgi:hypothetical protein